MQMALTPQPGITGGQTTISGNATSDTDVPPTGTVEITVRALLPRRVLQINLWGLLGL